MSTLFQSLLISHVLLGLIGIACFYIVWLVLLKENVSLRYLHTVSLLGFLALLLSWMTGGYYYALYYGTAVRSVIRSGPYPWAHALFMETKEHIFLFLPFLAFIITICAWVLNEHMTKNVRLRRTLASLAGMVVLLGFAITAAGVIISGAVR